MDWADGLVACAARMDAIVAAAFATVSAAQLAVGGFRFLGYKMRMMFEVA